jgi:uncharacterized protein YidB (DUF937 family)
MPRKSSTKTPENTTQAIADAFDTPLNLDWQEMAEKLSVSVPELQERIACKLDDTVFTWANIPAEHQSVIDAVARDLDAERSIRSFGEEKEVIGELPPVTEEIPSLPEEAQSEQSKHESTALTEKKTQAIQETREAATQTNAGITQTLTLLQAQQGLIDSSQAGTAYLNTYTANLTNVKGEGLTVIAAQMIQEISQKSGFDPNEVLKQVGVPLSAQTQEKLKETMGQVLGKVQAASTEIQKTSWGNGYDLQAEVGNLNNLMKSNDSVVDYWQ